MLAPTGPTRAGRKTPRPRDDGWASPAGHLGIGPPSHVRRTPGHCHPRWALPVERAGWSSARGSFGVAGSLRGSTVLHSPRCPLAPASPTSSRPFPVGPLLWSQLPLPGSPVIPLVSPSAQLRAGSWRHHGSHSSVPASDSVINKAGWQDVSLSKCSGPQPVSHGVFTARPSWKTRGNGP